MYSNFRWKLKYTFFLLILVLKIPCIIFLKINEFYLFILNNKQTRSPLPMVTLRVFQENIWNEVIHYSKKRGGAFVKQDLFITHYSKQYLHGKCFLLIFAFCGRVSPCFTGSDNLDIWVLKKLCTAVFLFRPSFP